MEIEVLGSGCNRCVSFANHVEQAINDLGLTTKVNRVFDLDEVKKFNVERTPALVVNGRVIVSGEVLEPEVITNLLEKVKN
ncbi:thioredoxin family protein [Bacillaceae bacterium W0354]